MQLFFGIIYVVLIHAYQMIGDNYEIVHFEHDFPIYLAAELDAHFSTFSHKTQFALRIV